MSTPEDIRQDARRDAICDALEREAPEPCGCLFLSHCCGAPPGFGSDVADDSLAGICAQCRDFAAFEPSEQNTWKLTGTTIYGDDADGNRGVPLKAWECRECGQEVEVTG